MDLPHTSAERSNIHAIPLAPRANLRAESGTVSWGAIIAGAAGAAAVSLVLLVLGTGLGLSALPPWSSDGIGATTFSLPALLWLTFSLLAASAAGGYLAGRLRAGSAQVEADEGFRDSVHGFLAWAIAALAAALLLTSTFGPVFGLARTSAGAVPVTLPVIASTDEERLQYFVDSVFRRNAGSDATPFGAAPPGTQPLYAPQFDVQERAAAVAEISRIFTSNMQSEILPAQDISYAGRMVSQRTGLSQQDAEKRVSDTYALFLTRVHNAEIAALAQAEDGHGAPVYGALWLFVSLLGGALLACRSATLGRRRRDNDFHPRTT